MKGNRKNRTNRKGHLLHCKNYSKFCIYGCQYCKYWKECEKSFENENGKMHYDVIMKKLQQITGLDMGLNASNLPEKFQRNLNQERR